MTTGNKNQSLGDFVRARRESRGLDYYEAEQASGLDHTFWRKLEAGQYEAPGPKSLEAIAKTLKVPLEDLYALAGYDLPVRLPSFTPYLRARYHLPHQAVVELERYFDLLRNYYDIPTDKPVFPPKPKQRKSIVPPTNRTGRRAA
jgi:transcriptional regulator with XRE-family HTH domain